VKRFKTAVLGGGFSGERDISLLSLRSVFTALKKAGWPVTAFDLMPDQDQKGFRRLEPSPAWAKKVRVSRLLPVLKNGRYEMAFLCLHGPGGEDGRLQAMLDLAGIKYTGPGSLASALAMNKVLAKMLFRQAGLPTPAWQVMAKGAKPGPLNGFKFVKPIGQGSALGVSLVKNAGQLKKALKEAWQWGDQALVEEYVKGRELTVAILGERALPVIEIIPKGEFYDWQSKYQPGGSRHICPAKLPKKIAAEAGRLALAAHRCLGCTGYSRVDLMLDEDDRLSILEVNTLPGMTEVSLMPDAGKAAGYAYGRFLEEMMVQSLKGL
jgi:D-alanine-D-alanine ligase